MILFLLSILLSSIQTQGCQFYPLGEYLRFVRVPESLEVGSEVLSVEVHPRRNLTIQPVDQKEDAHFFKLRLINSTHVSLRLSQSLENLVDNPLPQNVLKFRLVCDFSSDNEEEESVKSFLSVTVYVEDVNDHNPVFIDAPYQVNVDELTPTGLTVFRGVQAVDMDKPNTPNSELSYTLTRGNAEGKFSLEVQGHRPALVLKKPLDFDSGETVFNLTVTASDGGVPRRTADAVIMVRVQDSDDLNPRFTRDLYRTRVPESYPLTGKMVHKELYFEPRILAYDQDLMVNATVRYDIMAGNEKGIFYIDTNNGSLFLQQEVDLEALPDNMFVLQIEASQTDNPLRRGMARVEVEILDINDNLPQFEVESYNISIVENLPNGFSVLQVIASDLDQGKNAEFAYHLVDPSQAFSLDSRTGWLTVRNQARLDRETKPSLSMRVLAREKTPSILKVTSDSSVSVEVTLLDANDNNPTFVPTNLYEFAVSNVSPVGYVFGKVKAVDPDIGRNGLVRYEMKKDNKTAHFPFFKVSPTSGEISVAESPLPVGKKSIFIEATDQPDNPSERRISLALVSIEVAISEKSLVTPDFVGAPYVFWVGDDVAIGTSVGQIRVSEAVDRSHAVFDLLHSYHQGVPFAIEERSGTITVVDEIGKYETDEYEFEAVVTDERKVTLVTNVTVHIVDSATSHLEKPSLLEFHVKENKGGAVVGRVGVALRKQPKFSLLEETPFFSVSQDGTVYTRRPLDREVRSDYFVTVLVQVGRSTRYYQVHIRVEDVNDNPPKFGESQYELRVRENWVPSAPLLTLTATDPDLDSTIRLSLSGEASRPFSLSEEGQLRLLRPLDREERSLYTFSVVAKDNGNLSSEAQITVHVDDVNDNRPKFNELFVLNEDTKVGQGSDDLRIVMRNQTIPKEPPGRKKEFPTLIIPETLTPGTPVFRLAATDPDLGENGTRSYSVINEVNIPPGPAVKVLSSHVFAVHPMSGEVQLVAPPPPETEFLVNFTVTDGGGLGDSTVVRVKVEDINNNAPVFDKSWYDFNIPEGVYKTFPVGRVVAKDADFGMNGNITYSVLQKRDNFSNFPFKINQEGEISVTGDLDREVNDIFSFKVLAQDNGPLDKRLRSTVEVIVHVTDVNDNPPEFHGYERAFQTTPSEILGVEHKKDNFERSILLPVYFASVAENSAPGIPIARITANDSDLPDNGNGIVVYDILRKKNHRQLFAIDKEGTVTVTSYLDFETQSVHNVTIIASDLGNPSLSSTALLIVTVVDVVETVDETEKTLIPHNYYELEVEENCVVPVELLKVNTSRGGLRFSLVEEEDSSYLSVAQNNGTVYLVVSPDRELQPLLRAKLRVHEMAKRSRKLIYPVYPEDIGPNEIRVVIRVKDVNDNPPVFHPSGRPYVAAIPTTATYGYPVIRLHAEDLDEGLNGEIHYEMLSRDDSEKFSIDPQTGQVRTLLGFEGEKGRVFGFDVKATDRAGSYDGRTAIANVFVYVLDEEKKLIMVMGAKPNEIENNIKNITSALSNVTGLDVRVRKLEPHHLKEATDIYLYAVDPLMNVIIDSETLKHVLKVRSAEVRHAVEPYRLLGLSETGELTRPEQVHGRLSLSALELATIVLGCIVFLGAITSALCVICLHKRKRKIDSFKMGVTPMSADLMFHTKEPKLRTVFHHGGFTEGSSDSYISNRSDCGYRRSRRERHSTRPCPRPQPGLKASLASVHSSGRDSGIVETGHCCPCSHSPSHSSANSSHGSYEDSLKSLHRQHSSDNCRTAPHRQSIRNSLHPYPPPLPPPALSRHPSGRNFP